MQPSGKCHGNISPVYFRSRCQKCLLCFIPSARIQLLSEKRFPGSGWKKRFKCWTGCLRRRTAILCCCPGILCFIPDYYTCFGFITRVCVSCFTDGVINLTSTSCCPQKRNSIWDLDCSISEV